MATERQPQTLLIVDDERSNRIALTALFRHECGIMVAADGSDALRAAAGPRRPDLILLDIRLPDIDGREVCRRLKQDPATADIPVIFVSALADVAEQAEGFALGAVDYIVKPFHNVIVQARVRLHLRLKRQSDLLERLAALDPLTEIANRRAFDQALSEAVDARAREPLPVSLAMIDVDRFKDYNDSLGHAAGDECLRRISAALADTAAAAGGLAARYGGEEIGCVFVGIGATAARALAERLRAAVAALALPHPGAPGPGIVTVSVGIASVARAELGLRAALLEAADAALYRAKLGGRNRSEAVVLAD